MYSASNIISEYPPILPYMVEEGGIPTTMVHGSILIKFELGKTLNINPNLTQLLQVLKYKQKGFFMGL